ncbi:sugar porter family MFS transporter [Pedobacter aquatilis]|uniref:sugar porter family MFS transporter n=1 Tax=Pedobacter aquatilis TaxID=351343 RepID=UPI00292F0AC3|nr:sugar porter family MFS transporter [Pedobacter aquatilis]
MPKPNNHNHNLFILKISAVAALGGLLFGFDTAIISGAIAHLEAYFKLDALQLGWAVGCILIGCATGALIAGSLADRYGRKATLMLCALLFGLSAIGAGLSTSFAIFVFFRLLGGLGVGAAAMVSPMYIAESVPADFRGRLVSLYQLAIVLGILLAYGANYYFEPFAQNWRWMFSSQLLPSVLFFALLLLVPDTPRWLMSKNKNTEALAVLRASSPEAIANQNYQQILQSFEKERRAGQAESLKVLFSRTYRPVLFTGILVAIFQQITGINAILYYAPVIFKATGLSQSAALLQSIGIGLVNVLATFIAIAYVDKLGRKTFLAYGSLVMGLSLSGVAACFQYSYYSHYLLLIFMLIYVGAFACTLGAVTWVYLSEIFPNRIRALAMSLSTLSLWLADFGVTYSFPYLSKMLGTYGILYSYGFCCLIAFLFFCFRLPETKGKSLEEIEHLFI